MVPTYKCFTLTLISRSSKPFHFILLYFISSYQSEQDRKSYNSPYLKMELPI